MILKWSSHIHYFLIFQRTSNIYVLELFQKPNVNKKDSKMKQACMKSVLKYLSLHIHYFFIFQWTWLIFDWIVLEIKATYTLAQVFAQVWMVHVLLNWMKQSFEWHQENRYMEIISCTYSSPKFEQNWMVLQENADQWCQKNLNLTWKLNWRWSMD